MIAKLSGIFRMRLEHSLDVIMRGLFELLVLWCGGRGNARQCESERDRGCKIFCGDHLMSACPHLKPPMRERRRRQRQVRGRRCCVAMKTARCRHLDVGYSFLGRRSDGEQDDVCQRLSTDI